ncbi:P-loop containing nucleoside triphosphate hydrolase protein [Mycena crocata]|nr:P-loop containing nucleoside triphosphate hydrolase protein [Mycena crocata]
MSNPPSSITQSIYKAVHPSIQVTTCQCGDLTRKITRHFLDENIGMAPGYGANCVLSALAFSTSSKILLVRLAGKKGKATRSTTKAGQDLLQELLLCSNSKYAFQMDVLATSLYLDYGLRIHGAVDLLSVAKASRHSEEARMEAMGGVGMFNKPSVKKLFQGEENLNRSSLEDVALQAWAASHAATLDDIVLRLMKLAPIDTSTFTEARLSVFAKLIRDTSRLEALKPTTVKNEIASDHSHVKGLLSVTSTRFKNRVQQCGAQTVVIQGTVQGRRVLVAGRVTAVDGRAAKISVQHAMPSGSIKVKTVGREPPTNAESQRTDIILSALQRTSTIVDKPFFKAIWLPQDTPIWPRPPGSHRAVPITFSRPLNDSQQMAVTAILSPEQINVIHGPPGTGKTTVIAAAVTSMHAAAQGRTMWLVAQSNVAVKNIAEKLASVDFFDFKLLAARHEHLYEKINDNLIRSDQLVHDAVATSRQLLGSKVILCTLSMLSNDKIAGVARLVPVQTVVVDEASQVEVGNFLPMISRFATTLRKLVFIGDDKQLAPYGQGDISSLQSIFEIAHLRKGAIFLDTQMPHQLGSFISKHVYDGKLKTCHPDRARCWTFIDVKGSKEERKGTSWINIAEVRAAIAEARKCHRQGQSYRIITPYDAQRALLEKELESSKIPWEDTVFCVDSFQGNEADHIILSLVRTEKIGFLAEKRRVNVMLSRCKKGMRICTNRAFVEGKAKETLVGLLAREMGAAAWRL